MRYVAAAATPTTTMPALLAAAAEEMMMISSAAADAEPPLADSYLELLRRAGGGIAPPSATEASGCVQERELPLIDLTCLLTTTASGGGGARTRAAAACADAMARAASEWGFFQVTGHGVSRALLERLRSEQARLFRLPFETKATAGLLNGSYRWGAPMATSLRHLSWSEAFHVPLAAISSGSGTSTAAPAAAAACDFGDLTSLRGVMQEVAEAMSRVAKAVAVALAGRLLGHDAAAAAAFPAGCDETTCYLRLNRYPACPFPAATAGLVPHTDSDFLTVLCQDHVGGLQLLKDGRWVAVKPRADDALVVNIGDLFQAWSNDTYRSVEHRVVANAAAERFSAAYFLCPSYDARVGTCGEPSPYRDFTFGEYRRKVQEDVKRTGRKIGLPNFLIKQERPT